MLGTILRAQAIVQSEQSYWAPGRIYVMNNLLCLYFPAFKSSLVVLGGVLCVDQVVSFSGPLQY